MFGLPEYYVAALIFILGLILGSFLDVVASRFHTGKSLNGRSRCFSCGHGLSWYELFPLLSYLFLKGRCLNCHARIPFRLFLMEILTGSLFVYVFYHTTNLLELVFGLVFASLLIVIAIYDLRHMVIPNQFVIIALVLVVLLFGAQQYESFSLMSLFDYVIAACGASIFYGTLWLISKGRWIGLGDVKLAFPLGLAIGTYGVFSFVVLSFWVGALVSLVLLGTQKILKRGKHDLPFFNVPLTMKSEVPFAPFMIIAFLLVYFSHADIVSLLTYGF